jgi:hypothetical protein
MKFLVFAMDEKAHSYLKSKSSITSIFWSGEGASTENSVKFRSRAFNVLVNRKKKATLAILELGYNVIFADADVVLVRDPVPYLIWDGIDYAHSINDFCPM